MSAKFGQSWPHYKELIVLRFTIYWLYQKHIMYRDITYTTVGYGRGFQKDIKQVAGAGFGGPLLI